VQAAGPVFLDDEGQRVCLLSSALWLPGRFGRYLEVALCVVAGQWRFARERSGFVGHAAVPEPPRLRCATLAALVLVQMRLDRLCVRTDRLHGSTQLVGADAESLRPVTDFVLLIGVDAGAVLPAGLGLVVSRGVLLGSYVRRMVVAVRPGEDRRAPHWFEANAYVVLAVEPRAVERRSDWFVAPH
jgi:hypothetical protein